MDDVHRAYRVAIAAIGTDFLVNDVGFFLFSDCVNRADLCTGSAIDTAFVNPMSTHLFLPCC